MYFAKLLPWKAWSPIYDNWHVLFDIDKKYVNEQNECKQFVGRKLTDAESIGMLFNDPPDIPEGLIEHIKPKEIKTRSRN